MHLEDTFFWQLFSISSAVDKCYGLFSARRGRCREEGTCMWDNRLPQTIHLGQATRDLGEILPHPKKFTAHCCFSERVQEEIQKVHVCTFLECPRSMVPAAELPWTLGALWHHRSCFFSDERWRKWTRFVKYKGVVFLLGFGFVIYLSMWRKWGSVKETISLPKILD